MYGGGGVCEKGAQRDAKLDMSQRCNIAQSTFHFTPASLCRTKFRHIHNHINETPLTTASRLVKSCSMHCACLLSNGFRGSQLAAHAGNMQFCLFLPCHWTPTIPRDEKPCTYVIYDLNRGVWLWTVDFLPLNCLELAARAKKSNLQFFFGQMKYVNPVEGDDFCKQIMQLQMPPLLQTSATHLHKLFL